MTPPEALCRPRAFLQTRLALAMGYMWPGVKLLTLHYYALILFFGLLIIGKNTNIIPALVEISRVRTCSCPTDISLCSIDSTIRPIAQALNVRAQ